jgi:hypothetical protein
MGGKTDGPLRHFAPAVKPSSAQYICVLGSGDATNPGNFITRARCNKAMELADPGDEVVLYGCMQPGTTFVEAWTMQQYMLQHLPDGLVLATDNLVLEDGVKSTAESVREIVEYYAHEREGTVLVVTNWPYVGRVRRLLRYHHTFRWGPSMLGMPYKVVGCGGTFVPYVKVLGLPRAVLKWCTICLWRESFANLKAYADPHDVHVNQARTGFSWATTRQVLGLVWYRLRSGQPKGRPVP